MFHDLADHGGMSHDIAIGIQREGSDTLLAMAAHAMSLHDASDLGVIGRASDGGRETTLGLDVGIEQTTGSERRFNQRTFASQDGVECFVEPAMTWLIERDADSVLIVDRSVIEHGTSRVENEGVRRRARLQRPGQPLIDVVHDPGLGTKPSPNRLDFVGRIGLDRRHHQESNSARTVLANQIDESGLVLEAQRTGRTGHQHNQRSLTRELVKSRLTTVDRLDPRVRQ